MSYALLSILAVGVIVPLIAIAPALPVAMAPFVKRGRRYQYKKQSFDATVDSLIKNKLIERKVDKNGEIHISLTQRGRWEYGIRAGKVKRESKQKWDGTWRVVVFDVPEHKRYLRRELRHAIMLYGFEKLQQSVWIYPYPCEDFIELLQKHLSLHSDIVYATVTHLSNEKHMKKLFNL